MFRQHISIPVKFQIHLEYNLLIFLKMSIFVMFDCMGWIIQADNTRRNENPICNDDGVLAFVSFFNYFLLCFC